MGDLAGCALGIAHEENPLASVGMLGAFSLCGHISEDISDSVPDGIEIERAICNGFQTSGNVQSVLKLLR